MDQTWDFPTMSQRSLGPAWGKLDADQRERFARVFRGMILRTYANRFDGYASERFETSGSESSIAGTQIVRSVLHAANEDVHLDYRMRETSAGWPTAWSRTTTPSRASASIARAPATKPRARWSSRAKSGSSSSKETSTLSLTRVGLICSTVLFT